jgi:WD40 repeat protein
LGELGDIRIDDARSGAFECELRGHRAELMALAFRPGSTTLASAAADADLRLWDVASGRQTGFVDCDVTMLAVAFSPMDGTLAAGGVGRRLTLRDPATMAAAGSLALPSPEMAAAFAWSVDGRLIAVGDLDDETLGRGGVQIFEAPTLRLASSLETDGAPAGQIVVLSDGRLIAGMGREMRVWDVRV